MNICWHFWAISVVEMQVFVAQFIWEAVSSLGCVKGARMKLTSWLCSDPTRYMTALNKACINETQLTLSSLVAQQSSWVREDAWPELLPGEVKRKGPTTNESKKLWEAYSWVAKLEHSPSRVWWGLSRFLEVEGEDKWGIAVKWMDFVATRAVERHRAETQKYLAPLET